MNWGEAIVRVEWLREKLKQILVRKMNENENENILPYWKKIWEINQENDSRTKNKSKRSIFEIFDQECWIIIENFEYFENFAEKMCVFRKLETTL